jgi:serine/threonine-protein kinase RsbW
MSQILEHYENGVYTLKLPSVPESVSVVENFVDELVEKYQISEEVYGNIITSLNEAVTNAIYHGNKQNPNKTVNLSAAGFNFNVLPDPTSPENLENLTGRGVFIIKHLADQCIFNSIGNEVELHFKL